VRGIYLLASHHLRAVALFLRSSLLYQMAAPTGPGGVPPPARTHFQFMAGDPTTGQEARFSLVHDSPMVLALPFLPWFIQTPPSRTTIVRSSMVAILLDGCRPPVSTDRAALQSMQFLIHEILSSEASVVAHEYDKVGAFDKVYKTRDDWQDAIQGLGAKLAAPDLVILRPSSFYKTEDYPTRGTAPPNELLFLYRTSLADLLPEEPVSLGSCAALSRATLLAGSKDSRAERDDESSTVRVSMERVVAVLKRSLELSAPSAAGLARSFYTLMDELQLPIVFSESSITTWHACDEFKAAYTYAHGSAVEVATVEKKRILRGSRVLLQLKSILVRFSSPSEAYVNVDRMFMAVVPGASASTPTLTKLSQLDSLLDTAAWRSIVTHALSEQPGISGEELITLLVRSHTNVVSTTVGSGPAGFSGGTSTSSGGEASYGSVRASSVADALRLEGARDALAKAEGLSGVERVEAMLQADSVLLKRAELFQEPWLLNSVAALSSCSLDEPYLRPYVSQTLCEDEDSGEVPSRLKGYLIGTDVIPTFRSGKWSQLPIVEMALEIRSMSILVLHFCQSKKWRSTPLRRRSISWPSSGRSSSSPSASAFRRRRAGASKTA
jgi:hypothetical protein